jgi:hypothetical protein
VRSKLFNRREDRVVSKQVLLTSAWDVFALTFYSIASVSCGASYTSRWINSAILPAYRHDRSALFNDSTSRNHPEMTLPR